MNCCNKSPPIPVYLFVWIRVLTSVKMKNRSRIFAEFYLIPVISTMKWARLASVTSDSSWSLFPPLLLSIELYCSFKLNQYSAFVLLWLGKYYSWLNQQWAMLIFPFLYNDIFFYSLVFFMTSPKLCYRIESLLSTWLNTSNITTISLSSWRHSPSSSQYSPALTWTLLLVSVT